MNLGLTGKPVLVCAASSGLGRATALEFAREGAQVMLCGRREAELRRAVTAIHAATGSEVRFTVTDLTRPDEICRVVAATVEAFGGIYTLVNNTGGPPAGGFDQFDDAAWQAAFELLLLSAVRTTRAVLPHFRSGGGGRIVNFTSVSVRQPIDGLLLSNTLRTGVMALTKSLAGELGREGILLNVLGPGRIQTDRLEHLDQLRSAKTGVPLEQIRAEANRLIPLGRPGTPDEFARMAVFLGSPANTYITGQTLLVDGGLARPY